MNLYRSSLVCILSLFLGACASNHALKQPLPKGTRIAVISNFRDQALFRRVGTTTMDNASFYRQLPALKINRFVATAVTRLLHKARRFTVKPIYHSMNSDLLGVRIENSKNQLSPQYARYISRLTSGKRIDTVVLIVPDTFDFGEGQFIGKDWEVSGYGVFNRSFIFMQTNTIFAAYKIYVIDVRSHSVKALSYGDLFSKAHGIDVAWHKGYSGVKQKTLDVMQSVIKKKLPAKLKETVRKTGLI